MDCNMPGFPILHYLLELAQTHVHWVGDAISTYVAPFSFSFNLSQHQGLFQWVSSSYQMAKVLELRLQHLSSQWIFKVYFLWNWLVWSPCCPEDSQESFPSILWHSAFFMVQLSHLYMTTGKIIALTIRTFIRKVMSLLLNMLSRFVIAYSTNLCP